MTTIEKLNDYATIIAVLGGQVISEGRHSDGKQVVQYELLEDDGQYLLFYITIYNPTPEFSDVEAYVVSDKKSKQVSYYDYNSSNIYVDGKYVGTTNHTDLLDEVVDEFEMESKFAAHTGAANAYYNMLKKL